MKPVFEFKALFNTVVVYPHKVVLRPGMLQSVQEKAILFNDIADVLVKEASMLSRGLVHLSTIGETSQEPPSLFSAHNAENTFVFRHGNNSEAIQISKYIDDQRKNIHSLSGAPEHEAAYNSKHAKPPSPCDVEDFDRYRKLSTEEDWSGIFKFNSLTSEVAGVGKELKVLKKYLQENEVVFALAAGMVSQTETSNTTDFGFNTWLIVLTDRRILLLDHAMLSESVDTQSIRHERIQAVSSSQGWIFGKITIDIGNRSIAIDNCDKDHVKAFARISNDWLEYLSARGETEGVKQKKVPLLDGDPIEEIKRLAELKASGIINEEEFSKAKATLLAKI